MKSQPTLALKRQSTPYSRATAKNSPQSVSSTPAAGLKSRSESHLWHLLSQVFSLLWLGPIVTLLVLNFRHYVIGASIWCPFGNCLSDAFDDDAIATAVRLDKRERDLLASLQFVAQAFEFWFLMIATALLYDVGMIFARSPGGLPVGFLLTYLEFSDVKNLANPLLWISAFPSKIGTLSARKRCGAARLFLFALLAAFLTILTNLMGAATAVLLIPSLQWVRTEYVPQQIFEGILSALPPHGNETFSDTCTDDQLSAGNFSCTSAIYGPSLDEWAADAFSSTIQFTQPYGAAILGTSQESAVQFALNGSSDLEIIWIANRQVLRELSGDYLNAIGVTHNYLRAVGDSDDGPGDAKFNRSLQTILERTGPSVGVQANCYAGNVSVTKVADDKEIHCFNQWSPDDTRNYTKCFRIGEGFNAINARSRFWLGGDPSATAVDSYISDMATYYNETTDFNSGILPCLANDTAINCDWDDIFHTPLPRELSNSSKNVGLISYSIPDPPSTNARIYCDTVGHLSFPTYALDTSIESNMLHLVQLDNFPTINSSLISTSSQNNWHKTPLVIHPDWLLSAWSVDRNGTIPADRPIARSLSKTLSLYYADPNDLHTLQLFLYHIYSLGQAISLIPYNYRTNISSSAGSVSHSSTNSKSETQEQDTNRILTTSAQIHVWAWSLNARTSKLGVVITCAGCVCVIARLVLGVFNARREYSGTEMLMAMHRCGSDCSRWEGSNANATGVGGPLGVGSVKEREMARWRCKVDEDSGGYRGGRARFVVLDEEA